MKKVVSLQSGNEQKFCLNDNIAIFVIVMYEKRNKRCTNSELTIKIIA